MAKLELHAWYRQFRKLKDQAADAILLFRFGDFYETFDDDAKLIAELLDVTLTRKDYAVDRSQPKDRQKLYTPMAGMPYHAVERYVSDLVSRGYRVAIAEQLTETESSRNDTRPRSIFAAGIQPVAAGELERKMVHRAIVRVITPGTVIDASMLTAHANNYLAAAIVEGDGVGLAYADLSTGEFAAGEFHGERCAIQLQGELARLQAAEILVPDLPELRLPNLAPAQASLTQDLAPMTKDERDMLLPHERVARRIEGASTARWSHGQVTAWPVWRWELREAQEVLLRQLRVASLAAFGLAERPLATRAAGALVQYVHETQRHQAAQLSNLRVYTTGSFMLLDPQTRRNLELLEPSRQGAKTTLISVLDRTRTPMGARLLRRWLAQPLLELAPLQARQAAVATLVEDSLMRAELREALGAIGDMERAINRIAQGSSVATPRDLVQLRTSLRAIPAVLAALGGRGAGLLPEEHREQGTENGEQRTENRTQSTGGGSQDDDDLFGDDDHSETQTHSPIPAPHSPLPTPRSPLPAPRSPLPAPRSPQPDPCSDILDLLERALDDDPPALLGASNYLRSSEEGGERPRRVIRPGYEQRIDERVRLSRHAQEYLDRLEAKERERTGIKSLKVGYNNVFGYFIEVSRTTDEQLIPKDYERKQTLVAAERYVTRQLKEWESVINEARLQLVELERDAFGRLCNELSGGLERLRSTSRALAHLDTLAALAEAAVRGRYVRPTLNEGTALQIVAGRHPVVEQVLNDRFVANDLTLASASEQLLIITGPNMSGKSTVLRQVALIVLMAQIGSFVPAEAAEVGLVDRIFTRIGAQDDIATGQSTFMVEMTETAALLLQSTPRSLIILDEVGRGTSTYDGMAIARAVVEYIHNEPRLGCRTLFATHYHELTALEQELARLRNYHMAAIEQAGQVVFLHELRRGSADRSYGIHVAELAGIPREVITRASALLSELEGQRPQRQPSPEQEEQEAAQQNAPCAQEQPSSEHAQEVAQENAPPHPPPPPPAPAFAPIAPPDLATGQLSLFDLAPNPVLTYLRRLNLNEITPLEAMMKLHELQKLAGSE
ncbi:DNA mismatch repair protein MutS [Candidatus Viridilinea mediisalina]|uniref:DNA mismatch repair protein MutS n=1 Tax=Candidatus Viridilinea mediisalina TaxID=2024553 RepID=A0A2A6RKY3_9CHLR|nr:DNA mismatch repair protein MutS [Candidatus Viridilinea mediisalina]PDW03500.1 DNA mismatch repair protein MutS [Candidatus Viridilinea mediisalina]